MAAVYSAATPSATSMMWVAIPSMKSRSWLTNSNDWVHPARWFSSHATLSTSRWLVGSSRISTSGADSNRRASANRIYFPFIDDHPGTGQVFRTTPSGKQTYDHIAFFRARTERRLPEVGMADPAGTSGPDGFDYGMFNFYDLIAEALFDSGYDGLNSARKSHVKERTEHLLSDHMPIWTRIARPGFN